MLDVLYFAFLLLMFAQGLLSIYLSLYIWERPERIDETASPTEFARPQTSFSVLLPARHEEAVIGETIRCIADANYPKHLFEILVISDSGDRGTIAAARKAIRDHGINNAQVLTYSQPPINKPHGLNTGLEHAKKGVVVIFDAEDQIHPDIFNIANTLYQTTDADIIQAGVQLMNFNSRWFSVHNVLEYFFWFKSRMHFHTRIGMVPLGGNTVFFKANQLRAADGWDEQCLTEDAEIGIRMSVRGAKVVSTYDPSHVTREETPATVAQFIKQRTRWNQGFIQVLRAGYWREYDTTLKKALCVYTLSFPLVQAFLLLLTPLVLLIGFESKLPVLLSLFSVTPVLLVLQLMAISCAAIFEFTKEQQLKRSWLIFPWLLLTFLPYQLLLGFGAIRATYRELLGRNNWEKTVHEGNHRKLQSLEVEA